MNHWLLKSEPEVYGIDDLAAQPRQTDHWDGVRNYRVATGSFGGYGEGVGEVGGPVDAEAAGGAVVFRADEDDFREILQRVGGPVPDGERVEAVVGPAVAVGVYGKGRPRSPTPS